VRWLAGRKFGFDTRSNVLRGDAVRRYFRTMKTTEKPARDLVCGDQYRDVFGAVWTVLSVRYDAGAALLHLAGADTGITTKRLAGAVFVEVVES